jgi:hypothetical protein
MSSYWFGSKVWKGGFRFVFNAFFGILSRQTVSHDQPMGVAPGFDITGRSPWFLVDVPNPFSHQSQTYCSSNSIP